MKLKWKDIYNDNKNRRYCEITGIKNKDVELESNSFKIIKEKKYYFIAIALIIIGILLYTFKDSIKVFFMVMGFFAITGLCFFVFNYFRIICKEDGLYIRFGFQQGKFDYSRVKSVYLSKFNDYSFLLPTKSFNIVVRYIDKVNRIKELSFPNYFLNKQKTVDFLQNFEIQEIKNEKFVNFEKQKVFKNVAKIVAILLLFVALFAIAFSTRK